MFFYYKVSWYNSHAEKEEHDSGIVCADSYAEAANILTSDEGYDEVEELTLNDEKDKILTFHDIEIIKQMIDKDN